MGLRKGTIEDMMRAPELLKCDSSCGCTWSERVGSIAAAGREMRSNCHLDTLQVLVKSGEMPKVEG